jgi:hypothetical protein
MYKQGYGDTKRHVGHFTTVRRHTHTHESTVGACPLHGGCWLCCSSAPRTVPSICTVHTSHAIDKKSNQGSATRQGTCVFESSIGRIAMHSYWCQYHTSYGFQSRQSSQPHLSHQKTPTEPTLTLEEPNMLPYRTLHATINNLHLNSNCEAVRVLGSVIQALAV